jgi:hypothetical protein
MIDFTVAPKPSDRHARHGDYDELVTALLALPPDQALNVGTKFGSFHPEPVLHTKLLYGRAAHIRRLPDGNYIWLDPPKKAPHA